MGWVDSKPRDYPNECLAHASHICRMMLCLLFSFVPQGDLRVSSCGNCNGHSTQTSGLLMLPQVLLNVLRPTFMRSKIFLMNGPFMDAITKCFSSFQAAPATPAPSNATRPATLTISGVLVLVLLLVPPLLRVIPPLKATGIRLAVVKRGTRWPCDLVPISRDTIDIRTGNSCRALWRDR